MGRLAQTRDKECKALESGRKELCKSDEDEGKTTTPNLASQRAQLLREFDRVVYISCNPLTLRANLAELAETHAMTDFGLFDAFCYTEHVECGALLVRRGAAETGPAAALA